MSRFVCCLGIALASMAVFPHSDWRFAMLAIGAFLILAAMEVILKDKS